MIVYCVDGAALYRRMNVFYGRVVWAANAPGYFDIAFSIDDANAVGLTRLHELVYVIRDRFGRVFRGFPYEVTITTGSGGTTANVSGVGALGLFARRVVYGEKKFSDVAADNAVKALLRDALLRDGVGVPIVIESDTGAAPVVSLDCSWRSSVLDAVNDITERVAGLYVYCVDNDSVSNIVTRYVTFAPGAFNAIMSVEQGTASEIEYKLDYSDAINFAYGVGRKQNSSEDVITVGPFARGYVGLTTRRETILDNPSQEDAAELEKETLSTLRGPAKRISVVTSHGLRVGDAVMVGTALGNVYAVIAAADYTWPDEKTSYTLEVLDA